jgi:hypothetical protein
MSNPETPNDAETHDHDRDDSIVSPPAYPAYSTPPPEGLATNEDG